MTDQTSPHSTPTERATIWAYALLLFMGVIWGLALNLAKMAAVAGGHPVTLALWQVCVSAALMGALLLAVTRPSVPRRSVLTFSLFCGIFGISMPAMILFWCSVYLPAGIVALAFASMPVFTYLLSVMFRVETGTRRRFLGTIIGLIAMLLIILPDQALPSPELRVWVLLTLLASVSMSAENVYVGGMRPSGVTSTQLSFGRQFGAVIFLSPMAMIFADPIPVFSTWGQVQWAATGAGVLGAMAFTCLLYVINTSGPVFASQTAYIITLAGIAWGMVLFGEQHSAYVWAALVLTLLGITLIRPQMPRLSSLFTRT